MRSQNRLTSTDLQKSCQMKNIFFKTAITMQISMEKDKT